MKTRSSHSFVVSVLVVLALALGSVSAAVAQTIQLVQGTQFIAGGGTSTTNGVPATSWQLGGAGYSAKGMAVASDGSLYIGNNNVILRLDLRTGLMITAAGQPTAGWSDGAAIDKGVGAPLAQFQGIAALATDDAGNVYIAEGKSVYPGTVAGNARIRVLNVVSGQVYTLAGGGNNIGASGDAMGAALNARLNDPTALVVTGTYPNHVVYFTDAGDNVVRMLTNVDVVNGASPAPTISLIAGNYTPNGGSFGGEGVSATSSTVFLNGPQGLVFDNSGNLYIADTLNNRIRMVLAPVISGNISTVVGSSQGFKDGASALLNQPTNMLFSIGDNNDPTIYFCDYGNNRVRFVDLATGAVSTFGGNGTAGAPTAGVLPTSSEMQGLNGGLVGLLNGGAGLDTVDNLVVSFTQNLNAGAAYVGAGNNSNTPTLTTITALVQIIASGSGWGVNMKPAGPDFSVGQHTCPNKLCTIPITFTPTRAGFRSAQLVTTLQNGSLSYPFNLSVTGFGVGPAIEFSPATINTVNPSKYQNIAGISNTINFFNLPNNSVDGALYIATGLGDSTSQLAGNTVVRIDKVTGSTTTIAGTGTAGNTGDNGPATSALLNNPTGVAVDTAGNVWIADQGNCRIRVVNPAGMISGYGSGSCTSSGDGQNASGAGFAHPSKVVIDSLGNVFVAEQNRVRIIGLDGNQTIETYAGDGTLGSSGDGALATAAKVGDILALAVDYEGNLYIATGYGPPAVRKVDTHGMITTVAGAISGGTPATNRSLLSPNAIVATNNFLYIAEASGHDILQIDPAGNVVVVAGTGVGGYTGDGGPATSAQIGTICAMSFDGKQNLNIADCDYNLVRMVEFDDGSTPGGIAAATTPLPTLNFGTILSGTTSSSLQMGVFNDGTLAANFASITFPTDFPAAPVSSDCSTGTPLAPAAACTITAQFVAPSTPGSHSETVQLVDSSYDSPQAIVLNGASGALATQLLLQNVPTSITAGGSLITVTVSIEDANNNLALGSYPVTVNLYGPAPNGGGTGPLVVSPTFTVTNGTMTIPNTPATGLAAAGTYTLEAVCASCGTSGLTSAAVTFSVTANTSGPAHFQLVAPASAAPGTQFHFTVTAVDQYGNALSSYPNLIQFTSTDVNAVLPGASGLANGTYQFGATLNSVGPQTITATDATNSNIAGTSSTISVNAGAGLVTLFLPASPVPSGVVTLQASVNNGSAVTVGNVTFNYGVVPNCPPTQSLGNVQLVSSSKLGLTLGTATLNMRFPPGQYCLSATFNGTGSLGGSIPAFTSPQQVMTVTGTSDSDMTVGATRDNNNYDFSASVYGYSSAAPTGNVQLTDTSTTPATNLGGPVQLLTPTTPVPHTFLSKGGMPITNGIGIPVSGAPADFTNSGNPGGVVTNYATGTITVILPSSEGSPVQKIFDVVTDIGGGNPLAIAVGDFNGDGALDIAVSITNTSQGDIVRILLGDGQGNFTLQSPTYVSGAGPVAMFVADFNKDGHADLAIVDKGGYQGSASGTVMILLGNGDGTFQFPAAYAVGQSPVAITSGDFNNDGNVDLAVADYGDQSVSVLPGKGDGTFSAQLVTTLTGSPQLNGIVSGDFDGDGKLDLALANGQGNVIVLLGKADGTFQPQSNYPAGNTPSAIAVADFNADGALDLVLANSGDNTVGVLLGNGNGTFQAQQTYPVGQTPSALILGFFDKSLLPEVVVFDSGDNTLVPLTNVSVATMPTQFNVPILGTVGTQHTIQANYLPGPGANYGGASANTSVLVNQAATPINFSLSNPSNPIPYGTDLDLTMSITQVGGVVPGGTFSYQVDGGPVWTPALVGGAYILHLGTGLLGGSPSRANTVSVTYSGDTNYPPQPYPQVQTINVASVLPQSSLSASPTSIPSNGSTTLTATVTGVPASFVPTNGGTVAQPPTGTVTFFNAALGYTSGPIALVMPSSGATSQATLTLNGGGSGLTAVSNTFTASYSGDGNYNPILIAGSPSVTVGNAATQTGTALTVSPSNPTTGQTVTLTAVVTVNSAPVSAGTVTFLNGTNVLGTVPLLSGTGTASLTTKLASGAYSVVAKYSGWSSQAASSQSATQLFQVTGNAPSATTLVSQSDATNPANFDLTATVYGFGGITPAGTVAVNDTTTNTTLGSLPLGASGTPTFLSAQSFSSDVVTGTWLGTFNNAGNVVSADLNGDGVPDLIATDCSFGSVTVYLGNGDGTFRPGNTYMVGTASSETAPCSAVAVGDFNGDGIPDVAVSFTASNQVSILLGNGDGTLRAPTVAQFAQAGIYPPHYSTSGAPTSIAAADLNGDGKLDLVVNHATFSDCPSCSDYSVNSVGILLGNGDGTLKPEVSYSVGSNPSAVVVADFNGDGIPDIAAANYGDNSVSILLGNGDGTFQTQNSFSVTGSPTALAAADFNGDGRLDLAVGGNGLTVLLGQGDGTFQPAAPSPAFGGVYAMAVADINGDGKPDIVATAGPNTNLSILLGQGDGTFQAPQTYLTAAGFAVADFNGDGRPDVAAVNMNNHTLNMLLDAVAVSGQLSNVPFSLGQHALQAVYTPGSGVPDNTSSSNILNITGIPGPAVRLVVGLPPPSTSTTPYPATPGTPFPVLVTAIDAENNIATGYSGTVHFTSTDPKAMLPQNSTLVNGAYTFSATLNTSGSQTITAIDTVTSTITGTSFSIFVPLNAGINLYLSQNGSNPIPYGTNLSLTMSVNQVGTIVPTGSFTYWIDTNTPQTVPLTNGSYTLQLGSGLSVGSHTVYVTYSGDSNYQPQSNPQLQPITIVQGAVTLSLNTLTFGNQTVGTSSASAYVQVLNSTSNPVTLSGITPPSSDFGLPANSCGATLAALSNCVFQVAFTPQSTGAKSGSMTISASGTILPLSLSGTGVAQGAVTLSLNTLTFGNQTVGTSSASAYVQVLNSTSNPVTLSGITPPSSDFGLPANSCGATLAALSNCVFQVAFTPQSTGAKSGSMTISASGTILPLSLSGTGVAQGAVTLSLNTLSFGNQTVGTSSASAYVQVLNSTSNPVTLSGITPPSSDFGLPANSCGATLAALSNCVFQVAFTPQSTGAKSGSMTISASGTILPLSLSGTGVAQGAVTLSLNTLSFGNQTVGTSSASAYVQVLNSTSNPVTLSGITPPSSDFGLPANSCGATLAALSNCVFQVAFTPQSTGAKSGSMTISASGTILPLSLSGTGVAQGAVTLSLNTLSFGNQTVGTSSASAYVQVLNSTSNPVTLSGITPPSSDFGLPANSCGATLAALSNCVFQVAFTPQSTGAKSGSMTISASGTILPLSLSGTGVAQGAVTLSLNTLSFGNQTVGTSSASAYVQVLNSTSNPVTLSGITPPSSDFGLPANSCGATLAALSNCVFQVAFTPQSTGAKSGSMTISASGTILPLSLSGTGVAQGAVTLSLNTLSFGNQTVGTSSASAYVQVLNSTSNPVTLSGITPPSSDFGLPANSCGATLAALSNCVFQVAFTPQSTGAKSGSMTISASGTILPLSLSGTGVAQGAVTLSLNTLSFGNQTVGTSSASAYVQVLNSTSNPVTLSGITPPSSDFGLPANSCGATLAALSNCVFQVAFTPQSTGAKSGSMTISASGTILPLSLSGTGVAQGAVTLSLNTLTFGNQTVGTSSASAYVQVLNSTSNPVTLSGITPPSSDFGLPANSCGATLAALSNCVFQVAFTPQSTGAKSGSMTISASGTILPLSLSGTGVAQGAVTLSLNTLSFGNQTVGTSSASAYVQVLNSTSNPVTLSGITPPSSDFGLPANSCGATLAALSNCVFQVAFTPQSTGAKSGSMTISASGTILPLSLSGTGD